MERSTKFKYLGGYLVSNATFKEHILIKCKAAMLNIKIWNIRKYLTKEMCHKLILWLVISHLDYANSMLAGLATPSIKMMQKIQHTAARLTLGKNAKESTMECLKTLHWLPIQQWGDYQICTLIHKCAKESSIISSKSNIREKNKLPQPCIRKQERCSSNSTHNKAHFWQQIIQHLQSKLMELIIRQNQRRNQLWKF